MNRFALLVLLTTLSTTHLTSAEEKETEAPPPQPHHPAARVAPAVNAPRPIVVRPQHSFNGGQRQFGLPGQPRPLRPVALNSDTSIAPGALHDRRLASPTDFARGTNRIYTPRNVPVTATENTVPNARGDGNWRRYHRGDPGGQNWRNGWNNGDATPRDGNVNTAPNDGGNRAGRGHEWNRGNWHGGHHEWDRHEHNRRWWTSNYDRFAYFGGGCYYLNAGYWYPAYGYDPYFTTYSYDAPIYAYNDQEPGQVIANVQSELLRRGYNPGGVDGSYGPRTRRALLNYQSDNGLPVTGEIDEETLDSLGLR